MKKKLLSLVLAGAMVASTSVSAFADDATHEIQSNTEKKVQVSVEGNIAANDGSVLPSTVTVTVPTSASFTVNKDGNLNSATMSIKNSGDTPVSVIASEFVDTNGTQGINIVKEDQLGSTRNNVALKIVGGKEDIILTSEENGKMYKSDGSTVITSGMNFVIGNVTKDIPLNLTLTGKGVASTAESDKAVQDNFKLVLKIKQDR
ncbi:MAG: hypothetical protein U0N85_10035 [Clostridium sp.]|uniref:hypothetical protein n=1 Tax=Clostridium sp. TaxID=1506 RepID=UPI002F95D7C5